MVLSLSQKIFLKPYIYSSKCETREHLWGEELAQLIARLPERFDGHIQVNLTEFDLAKVNI